jgi:DNA-directed RNA polymerase beta subunit
MSNYYGSKGVVSTIVDDDKMLRTEDGRIIDIVISPLSVISRLNISTLYVASLGLISKELYNRLDKFFLAGEVDKKEQKILEEVVKLVLYRRPGVTLKEVYEESKKYQMVQIQAGAFDKYFSSEVVLKAMDLLGIKDHEKLYDPTTGSWIRTPIRVGYQDFMRLHFIAEHKMKTTGTNKRLGVIGYGDYREQGQSIGEQETWALMSHGDMDLLHKFSHERDEKAARFNQEMISIGLMLNSTK